jgi:hypothetical protein
MAESPGRGVEFGNARVPRGDRLIRGTLRGFDAAACSIRQRRIRAGEVGADLRDFGNTRAVLEGVASGKAGETRKDWRSRSRVRGSGIMASLPCRGDIQPAGA